MPQIKKILLVEDDLYIRDIYSTALERAGYDINVVADGKKALPQIKEYKPDLVLLDIMLPGIDGLEILKRIRSHPEFANIHPIVVIVTNLGQIDIAEQARRLGADGYIVKADINLNELVATIKSYEKAPR